MSVIAELSRPDDRLELLTPKEREVLDLVLGHRTTKDIARDLDISPNAVDLRLRMARQKLGARDRNDLARLYSRLIATCGKTTCGFPVIAEPAFQNIPTASESSSPSHFILDDFPPPPVAPWTQFELQDEPTLPEKLDQRFGRLWRVHHILLSALLMALIALAMLAISQDLGELL